LDRFEFSLAYYDPVLNCLSYRSTETSRRGDDILVACDDETWTNHCTDLMEPGSGDTFDGRISTHDKNAKSRASIWRD
jgi:hypothetical protein